MIQPFFLGGCMEITKEVLESILNSYPYQIVFVDCTHTVRWMNTAAKNRYAGRVKIGDSIFHCHNESSRIKIENFLQRAKDGEGEMFEAYNPQKNEREFFTPVKDDKGNVIGYFERHEVYWDKNEPSTLIGK